MNTDENVADLLIKLLSDSSQVGSNVIYYIFPEREEYGHLEGED